MRKSKRIRAVLCTLAIVLWFAAGLLVHVNIAFAEEQTGSLTLWCVKDDDIVSGMHWQIYRVGHRAEDDYVFEGDFAGYRATLGDKDKPMLEWDADTVAAAGEALKYKTIADEIPFDAEGKTNGKGALTFDGLENGLYLVWGDVMKVGKTTYIPSAIFFEMNGEDAAVLNAYPKIILHTLGEEELNYSVRKVWQNDENQPWNRAVSITVERYRDNRFYDTITLGQSNDWTFAWEDSDEHVWFVYEREIPPNYTVSYTNNHTQYLIVNTFEPPTDDSSTTDTWIHTTTNDIQTDVQTTTSGKIATTAQTTVTDGKITTDTAHTTATSKEQTTDTVHTTYTTTGEKHTTESVETTESQLASTASDTTAVTGSTERTRATTRQTYSTTSRTTVTTSVTEEKAPQTGQLWWPVPILAAGGVILLGFGMHLTKKDDNE